MTIPEILIKTAAFLFGLRIPASNPPTFDKNKVKRILAVRNDNLGDVIVTVPSLRALRETFPNAYLAVLVNSYTYAALEGIPWIDKIYTYDKFKHGKHKSRFHAWRQQLRIFKEFQKDNFDLAVGIRSAFSSSMGFFVYASAAKWRLGPEPGEKHRKYSFLFNIFHPRPKEEIHEVDRCLNMMRALGIETKNKELEFFIPKKYDSEISGWFRDSEIKPPVIGIFLSQRKEAGRFWNVDQYAQLIKSIQERNQKLILIYPPSDRETAEKVLKSCDKIIPSFSTPDLKLLGAMLKNCDPVIILEGGGMHLATAVGSKVIALYGKTNPRIWHPWGTGNIVLKRDREAQIPVEEVVLALYNYLACRF